MNHLTLITGEVLRVDKFLTEYSGTNCTDV